MCRTALKQDRIDQKQKPKQWNCLVFLVFAPKTTGAIWPISCTCFSFWWMQGREERECDARISISRNHSGGQRLGTKYEGGGGSLVNQIMISGYIGGKNIINNVIVREATLSLCRVRWSLLFSCLFNNEIESRRKEINYPKRKTSFSTRRQAPPL